MMDKYLVKTTMLKNFTENSVIERVNDHQYSKEDETAGGPALPIDVIERNPEWFYKIERHSDFCKEIIEKWDNDETVWSIEMGGLGPGYEQAIQVLMIEIVRILLDYDPKFEKEEDFETVKKLREKAVDKLNDEWGYSGAQVGAATGLAYHFWVTTPQVFMKDPELEDRKIQINNFTKK